MLELPEEWGILSTEQKAKETNGCLKGCGILSFLIVGACIVLGPDLVAIKPIRGSLSAKNRLVNGIKECVIREADGESTNFSSVQSFKDDSDLSYVIQKSLNPILSDSCFTARAQPISSEEIHRYGYMPWQYISYRTTWFEIKFDPKTGNAEKTCGDSSKKGCNKGNTW